MKTRDLTIISIILAIFVMAKFIPFGIGGPVIIVVLALVQPLLGWKKTVALTIIFTTIAYLSLLPSILGRSTLTIDIITRFLRGVEEVASNSPNFTSEEVEQLITQNSRGINLIQNIFNVYSFYVQVLLLMFGMLLLLRRKLSKWLIH